MTRNTADDAAKRWATVALLALVALVAWPRAYGLRIEHEPLRLVVGSPRYDFSHFWLDGRHVWKHGALNPDLTGPDEEARRRLPFYLPLVPLALAPVMAGGKLVAASLWTLMHVASLGYVLWALARTRPVGREAGHYVFVCVLMAPAVYEAARFNQLSFLILALLVGAVSAVERRQCLAGGALLGLATLLKLLPGVLLIWLALKRRWVALGSAIATMLVLGLIPPLIAFGPQRTLDYHWQWLDHNLGGVMGRGLVAEGHRGHFVDHRNQSIGAVAGRLFQADHPHPAPWQPLQLSAGQVRTITVVITALLGLMLLWLTRRSADRLRRPALRAEAAAFLLAMIVFAPLARQYYLVWAMPAVFLMAREATAGATLRARALGLAAVTVWALGQAAWLSETLRTYGIHLLMLIIIGGLLLAWTGTVPRRWRASRG